MNEHNTRTILGTIRAKVKGREQSTIDTILNLPGAVKCFIESTKPLYPQGMETRSEVRLAAAWIASGCPASMVKDERKDDGPIALIGPGGDYTRAIGGE